jgi:hypothetical protein
MTGMKIQFVNVFHRTTTEVVYSTTNREVIRLDARRVRRILDELCGIGGCDCLSDMAVLIDGQHVTVNWIDRDAEDDQPGIEICLPPGDSA